MQKLTNQEREAMLSLWRIESGTAREILDAHSKPKPHYNTLRSTLDNLQKKKYLHIKPVGNTNVYYPIVNEIGYKRGFVESLVKDHFKNSYKGLVTFFAEEDKLSPDDIKDILDIIKKRKIK